MPCLGLGLHLAFAIHFAVHAVRTNQGPYADRGDRALAAESLAAARRLPRHTREADRTWITPLQKLENP